MKKRDYLTEAKKQYKTYKRNYLYYKDLYEDYFLGKNIKEMSKKEALKYETKMKETYNILQILVRIFGNKVQS